MVAIVSKLELRDMRNGRDPVAMAGCNLHRCQISPTCEMRDYSGLTYTFDIEGCRCPAGCQTKCFAYRPDEGPQWHKNYLVF